MNTREYPGEFAEETSAPPTRHRTNGQHRAAPQSEPLIKATPFVFREPRLIPPRQLLYGRHLIRRFISCTVSPGGLGKSSLALLMRSPWSRVAISSAINRRACCVSGTGT